MPVLSYDVARVRGLYPTLGAATVHLDGSFSALQPESVIRAIISSLRSSPAQPGSHSARSQRGAAIAAQARRAVADLVGVTPECVVLGATQASLLMRFASLLSREWQLGDEIVVNRMDADIAWTPWVRAARSVGGIVQWAEVDLESGELPAWQYERLVDGHTRIVTLPLANAATGTVPHVEAISAVAHAYGALVVVDGGAAIPHLSLDLDEIGADLLSFNAATFGGPTVAAVVTRPGLLDELQTISHGPGPERFEFGPLPIELLDGLTAAVDHLADLSQQATGSRRERLVTSLTEVGDYEHYLYEYLDEGLRSLRGVTVLGTATDRLPMAAITVSHQTPAQVGEHLQRSGISAWTGPSGLSELITAFGADEIGGATYVGVMPHTTRSELDILLNALDGFGY